MVKDDLVYAGHMLDIARSAVNKITRRSRADFDGDDNLRLALAHLVQTIGEAARHVSAEFQARNPTISWSKIVGMRHRVVHDYMHVDFDIVWDVVTRELPPLIGLLSRIVPENESET